jgi:hypothetical protein
LVASAVQLLGQELIGSFGCSLGLLGTLVN